MDVEIRPEPTPQEREALLSALGSAGARAGRPGSYWSVWRLAGLLENVDSGADGFPAAAPDGAPRSSRGASRA